MLRLTIPSRELWDESNEMFVHTKPVDIVLEHSLISLSKWESEYKKPFLTKASKTRKETLDYIRFMTLTQNVPSSVYDQMTNTTIDEVEAYIDDPMTATFFVSSPGSTPHSREIITAELIYYWMIAFQIPFDRERWHLNRLLTLIRVCNVKNQNPKKRSKGEVLKQNRSLNEARRKKLNTKG